MYAIDQFQQTGQCLCHGFIALNAPPQDAQYEMQRQPLQLGQVCFDDMIANYADRYLRRSPTFQAVTRSDNLRGAGSLPRLTMRQTVAAEQLYSASTTGWRTFAESGRKSKFLSASGIEPVVPIRFDMSLPFLRRSEHVAIKSESKPDSRIQQGVKRSQSTCQANCKPALALGFLGVR